MYFFFSVLRVFSFLLSLSNALLFRSASSNRVKSVGFGSGLVFPLRKRDSGSPQKIATRGDMKSGGPKVAKRIQLEILGRTLFSIPLGSVVFLRCQAVLRQLSDALFCGLRPLSRC